MKIKHNAYAISIKPTPVLNTPDFAHVFGSKNLPADDQGLVRAVEMIALPETKFKVIEQASSHILKVQTTDYPNSPLFIDSRFVKPASSQTPERKKILPSQEKIFQSLKCCLGSPYIWGGNWSAGIPEILSFYGQAVSPQRLLQGVDCSGLLYEATNGFTPRNTKELLFFGKEVSSLSLIKPLDIIVWPGHVIIALSSTHSVESAFGKGVIIAPIKERLPSHSFFIRRFN